MKWYTLKRKKEAARHGNNKAAEKIAVWILKVQAKFAHSMNHYFSKLSVKKRRMAVVTFFLLAGGASVFFLANALSNEKNKALITPGRLQVPKYVQSGEETIHTDAIIAEESFEKLEAFKRFLDSLSVANPNKYIELLDDRPGILDSIHLLEQIYYSQKIK